MSYRSSEFAWNSVDVRGADGLLHNGRVIDAVNGGLIVHFGGTGDSGPKLVHFSRVYHRQYSDYLQRVRMDEGLATPSKERPVEVLLRLQPEDRWKWYPGVLLNAFGLVSVTLLDGELKGFVVEQRLRERSSQRDYDLLVDPDRFSKWEIVVPSEPGVALPSDDELVEILNQHCRDGRHWLMATRVLNNPRRAHNELAVLALFQFDDVHGHVSEDDDEFVVNGVAWPQHHGIRKKCCRRPDEQLLRSLLKESAETAEYTRSPSPALPDYDGDIQSMYRDPTIFPQIFECLTTFQQTMRRGVCKTWDAILTSACIRRVINVTQPRYGRHYTRSVYCFASYLYHCWTQQTRVLVLYGGKNPGACEGVQLAEIVRLLQRIWADKGLSVVEVLLLTREWHFRIKAANRVHALWNVFETLADVCQQVVVKNAGANVEVQPTNQYDPDFMVVRFSNQRITRQLTVNDFWTMLDKGLSDLNPEDGKRLAEWVSRSIAQNTCQYHWNTEACQGKLAQILNTTQKLDPRDGVRYRTRPLSGYADLDGVDVQHLTKLTLHTLLQYFDSRDHKFRIVFRID